MAEILDVHIKLSHPQNQVAHAKASIIAEIAGQSGGKTLTLGVLAAKMILACPGAKGFIGANTHDQVSGSTMTRVFWVFKEYFGMTEYDRQSNPQGHYVVDKKPPKGAGWTKPEYEFKSYNNIMTFWNGATVFIGSLDNYKAHDGKEFAWAHLDETKDTKKEALTMVILGRLRQYGLWITPEGNTIFANQVPPEIAAERGLTSWNPCYIHTSPAEGNVEWLIDLLGIRPYEKEILDTIVKKNDYFYKKLTVTDPETKQKSSTEVIIYNSYWNEYNIRPGFLQDRTRQLSKSEVLKFIFGNPFGRNGGEYLPDFDRFKHTGKYPHDPKQGLFTAWDFNATPYVTCLVAHVKYIMRWFDPIAKVKVPEKAPGCIEMEVLRFTFIKEYTIPDGTTEGTADAFADDFEEFNSDIFVNGDASGYSRIEGLGADTQYKIIGRRWANRLSLPDSWLRAKKVNIQNTKRRKLMNDIFSGRLPDVEVVMDAENCPNLVRDCEYLLVGADGAKHKELEKDKNGIKFQKLGHPLDACEYLVCETCKEFLKL